MIVTTATTTEQTRTRPAASVLALVLTTLIAGFTSGGAVYFSLFWSEAPDPSLWTVLFAVAFVLVSVAGVLAAVWMTRGSERGRRGLMAYATFGILFTLAKLIWWQETEALVFGGLDIVLLLLVSSRRVREWTGSQSNRQGAGNA